MQQNKTGKYLKYAIGEIVLVVIGILIALSINNWNKERQTKKNEDKLLTEMLNSIKSDYAFLNFAITVNKKIQTSCEIILSQLNHNATYHDSLEYHFMNSNNWMTILLRKNGYEKAKSYGLEFMSDSLRNKITNFYENRLVFMDVMMERQNLYYYNIAVPLMTGLFQETITPSLRQEGVAPYDYEALKGDLKYRNILKTNIRNRGLEVRWIKNLIRRMEILEKTLIEEIKNRL